MQRFQGSFIENRIQSAVPSAVTDQFLGEEVESDEETEISLHQAARDGHIERLKVNLQHHHEVTI